MRVDVEALHWVNVVAALFPFSPRVVLELTVLPLGPLNPPPFPACASIRHSDPCRLYFPLSQSEKNHCWMLISWIDRIESCRYFICEVPRILGRQVKACICFGMVGGWVAMGMGPRCFKPQKIWEREILLIFFDFWLQSCWYFSNGQKDQDSLIFSYCCFW